MLRLSPPPYQKTYFTRTFDACYGGGEANVAVSLSQFGLDTAFVTKVPYNAIGDAAIRVLQEMNVHTRFIARGGTRLGIYYLEHGASIRPSQVLYDRSHSAIAEASEKDFNFPTILKGAHWFHVSGITPALSPACAQLTKKILIAAKKSGLTTSFDLNYRKKLWTPQQAQAICIPLMRYVDVCIGNEEDAEMVLGITPEKTDVHKGKLNIEGYYTVCRYLQKKFKFKYMATTLRQSISASDNNWSAILYDGKQFFQSKEYSLHIVDRIGGGDAFSAGLIYAMLVQYPLQKVVDFAVAASALKHTIQGDFNQISIAEVQTLIKSGGRGRIIR